MTVAFDRFVFDPQSRALLENSTPVRLGPKAFRLLEMLIDNRPRALSKEELYAAIWPDTFVDESNLAGLVTELRAALGDRPRTPRFIRTVHGFGYAFCADVNGPAPLVRGPRVVFRGREFPLHEGRNVIGRDADNDVSVDDGTVSRKHAVITIGPDGTTVEDLASKNGTFVEGSKIAGPVVLVDGQTIVVGDARLVYRVSASAGSTITMG